MDKSTITTVLIGIGLSTAAHAFFGGAWWISFIATLVGIGLYGHFIGFPNSPTDSKAQTSPSVQQ